MVNKTLTHSNQPESLQILIRYLLESSNVFCGYFCCGFIVKEGGRWMDSSAYWAKLYVHVALES